MGSSSRKKSISKKKSSKLSSKVRGMKKSKRTRSRKRGRRHDTSTDDDSLSSLSITSPDDSYSDGDSVSSHSRRRSIKKREKRSLKTSSRRKDSRNLSRSKKRKKPKKNDDSKPRKKLKRDVKISSASSDSHSCSTCNDSISDIERSEGERVKKRSREHQKSKRDRGKGKSVSPLSTSRSPSPSYIGYQDAIQTISQSEETFTGENSQRLRSVIVIPEKPEDMQFEEIVNDHDDFPCKSSSGEGGKKGPTLSPPDASAFGRQVEKDGFPSDNNGMSELTAKRIGSLELEVERVSETKVSTDKSPLPDSGPGSNDLEAILKQKALENLKKFRGARKTSVKSSADQKDVNSGDHSGSVCLKTETGKNKSPQLAESTDLEIDIPSGEFSNKASGPAKQCSRKPPDATLPDNLIVEGGPSTRGPVVSAEKTHIETESSLSNPEPRMITRQKSPSSSLGANQGTAGSSALAESAAAENAENPSLNNQPDEAKKDSSQYQQKTMSVMRGGEMVQVKYKVYIPKRASTLARRHLNRSDSDRTAGC